VCYFDDMSSPTERDESADSGSTRRAHGGGDASALAALAPEVASAVVRVAGDIALVVGEDGVIRSVAESGLPLQGAGQDWVGRAWTDVVDAGTRRKVELLLQEARQQGWSRRREFSHPGAGGGEIPLSWAAVRLGAHGPLLAVGRDLRAVGAIQQRFLDAQQELERDYWQRRQSESHYRLMFQVAHDAVLVLDAASGEVLDANPAAGALFDNPQAGWQGAALRGFVDPAVQPAFDELLAGARSSGRAAEVRLRVAASGAPVDVSATPFRAEGRRCLLLRARRAVAPAGDTQSVLDFVRQTPDAVVVTDAGGRVLWANPAFAELCQAPDAARLRGTGIAQALGDDAQQWATLLARVRARGIVGHAAVRLRLLGAPPLQCEVSAALLAEGDQEHIGFTLRPQSRRGATVGLAEDLSQDVGALVARLGQAALPDLMAEAATLIEKQLIGAALQRVGGRLDGAADLLRLSAEQLVLRMHRLGLAPPDLDGRSRGVH